MIIPYYVTYKNIEIGSKKKLESHIINHAKSILTITPTYPDFGIETRYIKKSSEKWLIFTLD